MERTRRIVRAIALAFPSEPYTLAFLSRISKLLGRLDASAIKAAPASRSPRSSSSWLGPHQGLAPGSWRAVSKKQQLPLWNVYVPARRPYSTEAPQEDVLIKARFVRFFALFMMLAAGVRVAPYVAASSVGHTLGLLDTQEPFLLRSGLSRLMIVVRASSSGHQRALEGGAVPKLLRLVEHEDARVVDEALQALEMLVAGNETGLEELRRAGGERVLQALLQRTANAAEDEDTVYRAHQLLGDLRRWQALEAVSGGGS